MPITTCQVNGVPGYKWGNQGKCYTYQPGSKTSRKKAKRKAILQGVAIDERKDAKPTLQNAQLGLTEKKRKNLEKRLRIKKPPALLYPLPVEREYKKQLRGLVGEWLSLYNGLVDSQLERIASIAYIEKPEESVGVKVDATNWSSELSEVLSSLEISINETIPPWKVKSRDIGQYTSEWNDIQWQKTMKSILGVNVFTREPWLSDQLDSFSSQNVALIKKLANDTQQEIDRIMRDGFQNGKRIETIRKEIKGGTGLTGQNIIYRTQRGKSVSWFMKATDRADLIAADQVGKLNGQLTQLRQNEVGVSRYIWRTSLDERVRKNHKNINNKLCDWNNATTYKNNTEDKKWKDRGSIDAVKKHPGQDYRCRCYAEADFSTLL